MRANAAPMPVADYCNDYNTGKIVVNREYQRSEGVWSPAARSFFVESILLEYPIPKLYLYARLDLKTRQTIKEIVDGQQRSQALVSFFNNKLRLGKNVDTPDLRGLKYNQLSGEWQTKFLSYSLPIDQFSGVPEDEVREAFRRMNANNVPLNDEEQRNARFQGIFKWFIISIAERYKNSLFNVGLFSRRDLIRMADLRMYAEILLVIDDGFHTVKAKQLDEIYKKYNAHFSKEELYHDLLTTGIDFALRNETFLRVPFLRAHVFQSIILAIITYLKPNDISFMVPDSYEQIVSEVEQEKYDLDVLADALTDPEAFPGIARFIHACSTKTNVEDAKVIRFIYFLSALKVMKV